MLDKERDMKDKKIKQKMAEMRELLSDDSLANLGYEKIQHEASDPMMGKRMVVRLRGINHVGTIIGIPGVEFGIAHLNGKTTLLTTQSLKVELDSGKIVFVRPPKVDKDEEDS